jgi:hypothetical protein
VRGIVSCHKRFPSGLHASVEVLQMQVAGQPARSVRPS